MRILLINPPEHYIMEGNLPKNIYKIRGDNIPLGLLYIATYLNKYASHSVKIIDAALDNISYNELENEILNFSPDVVGITACSLTMKDAYLTAKSVKRVNKDIKVIMGGLHPSFYPYETVKLPSVDFVIKGEAEESLLNLLNYIDDTKRLRHIDGLYSKINGEILEGPQNNENKNLDGLPFPARELINYRKYHSILHPGKISTILITSRGCPFKCIFCDHSISGKLYRTRSAKNVVDEIEECVKNLGITDFLIDDDIFTFYKKRVVDICDEIIKRKLDIRYGILARVDTIDEEIIKKLKASGCVRINFGVESGSQRILNKLNKNIKIEQIINAFNIVKKEKIDTQAYIMIGNPGETTDDINKTIELLKKLNPDYIVFLVFTIYPGSPAYKMAIEKNILKYDPWRMFAENPLMEFNPPVWNEYFARNELYDMAQELYKKFYIRPKYVLKQLLRVRGYKEFKQKAIAAQSILNY